MIRPAHRGIEVWLCVEPVDFRKQMTGLATLVQDTLVQDTLAMDPFSAQLFVFTNRRRTQCRILYWERCGFVLWHKRLERERFAWPRRGDGVVTLTDAQLNSLEFDHLYIVLDVSSRSSPTPTSSSRCRRAARRRSQTSRISAGSFTTICSSPDTSTTGRKRLCT